VAAAVAGIPRLRSSPGSPPGSRYPSPATAAALTDAREIDVFTTTTPRLAAAARQSAGPLQRRPTQPIVTAALAFLFTLRPTSLWYGERNTPSGSRALVVHDWLMYLVLLVLGHLTILVIRRRAIR
jgi:hypothetical protein